MTSIYAFSGPAGSGKTFALDVKLRELCSGRAFEDFQCVLAITFMHGSRRRLVAKLGKRVADGVAVRCETIDSFCLRMVNRYRQHLDKVKPIRITQAGDDWTETELCWTGGFNTIRKAAVSLLQIESVQQSVAAAYPIILIDEFQDCHGELLTIVQLLSLASDLIVAADDFQCFHTDALSPAVNWISSSEAQVVDLIDCHRTNNRSLLDSALALRSNTPAASSIEVITPAAPGIVAWDIFTRIAWGKTSGAKSRVLISPAGPDASPWVKSILEALGRELGKARKLGPMPFSWEDTESEKCAEAQSLARNQCGDSAEISTPTLRTLTANSNAILRLAAERACRLASIRGVPSISLQEFQQLLELASHSLSAYRCERPNARLAMTVYGAKNREFDYVFVLWPYKVPAMSLQQRKLLYNALTRARLGATLIIQGGEKRVREDAVLNLLACGYSKKPR